MLSKNFSKCWQILFSERKQVLKLFEKNVRCLSNASNNNEKILKSLVPDVEIPEVPLHDYIFKATETFSNQIASECSLTKRKYTYNELFRLSRYLAINLRKKLKLVDDEIVITLFPNISEIPIITLGLSQANLINSTANPIYTPEEIRRQIIQSNAKCIITTHLLYQNVKKSLENLPEKIPILVFDDNTGKSSKTDGAYDFLEFLQPTNDNYVLNELKPRHANDLVFLPYSSGTTGLPKGVELTHRNVVGNLAQQLCEPFNVCSKGKEIIPAILPMFHIYGLSVVQLRSLVIGAKMITLPKFTPIDFTKLIKEYKPTQLLIVPPIVLFMNMNPAITKADLSGLNMIMSGAAPLGKSDIDKFKAKFEKPDLIVGQGYGLTETAPIVSLFAPKLIENCDPSSIGALLPNTEIKVVNTETLECLGPNENGELCVRGPQVMKQYHKNEKATKESFLPGNWFRTGDMIYYKENGLLYVTDRLKELIKVKGFQVAPAELEEILRTHPKIGDAAVVGKPDQLKGEVPFAFIVPKDKITEQEIKDYVAERVAPFKKLEGGIKFLDSIPRNLSGKILRRELKETLVK